MLAKIASVESFALKIERDEPYLGPLEEGNVPNEQGVFIRPRNKTIYSISDHCVLVKVTTESGHVGWGECVAVVTPHTVTTIVDESVVRTAIPRLKAAGARGIVEYAISKIID